MDQKTVQSTSLRPSTEDLGTAEAGALTSAAISANSDRNRPGAVKPGSPARRAFEMGEFLESVLALRPKTAVFDCDGTLWSGDAGYGFMVWSMAESLVSRNASDWMDSRYREYRAGKVSEETMCGEMVQLYAGLREEELRQAAALYVKTHIGALIFPEMEILLEKLRAAGTELWAVSSTNDWVIEAGVERFGIPPERVLAAKVRVKDGVATSELLLVPTDEAKAEALVAAGLPNPAVVFGNSIHDAAMLAIAERAYPVNPTAALLERSQMEGWQVYYPQAVRRDSKA